VAEGPPPAPERRSTFLASAVATYATTIAVAVLSLVNVLIVARALHAVGRGEVAFLTTVASLTAQLAAFGIPQASSNFAGRRPEQTPAVATNAVLIAAFAGLGAIGVVAGLFAIVPAAGGDVDAPLRWLAVASVPMLIVQACLQAIVLVHFRFAAYNASLLVTPVLNVAVNGVLALTGGLTVGLAVGAWIAGQLVATVILATTVARGLGGFGRPEGALAGRAARFGAQAYAGRVLYASNYRLDQWIVASIAGSRELGVYSVAVAWTEALFLLPTALSAAQRGDVTRADRASAARHAATVFRATVLLTVVSGAAMVALAPFLAETLFGSEFADATGQIRVLVLGAFGIAALKLLGSVLTAQGRPLRETAAVAVAFVVMIVLDALLIPSHGGMGAAIASAAAYSAGGLAVAWLFVRTLGGGWRDLVPRGNELGPLWARVRAPARGLRAR
jgi:O-antigen/teichoic acid export membrane protein